MLTGNVVANDAQGADGATLTHVQLPGAGSFVAITTGTSIGGGAFQFIVSGVGTYTFKADGSWTLDPAFNVSSANQDGTFNYRITDADGDSAQAIQPITVENSTVPLVQTANFTGIVEEEHLHSAQATGIDDTTGNASDADVIGDLNVTTATTIGNLSTMVDGIDGTATYGFNVADGTQATFVGGGNVQSQGANVIYDVQGSTLWGFVNTGGVATTYDAGTDRAVFKIDLNTGDGQFTFALLDNIDHHPVASADNLEGIKAIDLSGKLTVSNSADAGSINFNNVSVNVIDDIPVAADYSVPVNEGQKASVNLILIIDQSGSMQGSRLTLAKAALANLLNTTEVDINQVMTVSFQSTAAINTQGAGVFWTDKADALSYVNGLSAGGNTNYDAAVNLMMSSWGSGPTAADQTLIYFVTDGVPNPASAGLSGAEITAWETFLRPTMSTSPMPSASTPWSMTAISRRSRGHRATRTSRR